MMYVRGNVGVQSGSRKNEMDGGTYKEERNEVQVRQNKLCSCCTCTSLSVNVEWIWLNGRGAGEGRGTDVVQAISPSVSDLPSRAPHHLCKSNSSLFITRSFDRGSESGTFCHF